LESRNRGPLDVEKGGERVCCCDATGQGLVYTAISYSIGIPAIWRRTQGVGQSRNPSLPCTPTT
jgi:hypothetical protein